MVLNAVVLPDRVAKSLSCAMPPFNAFATYHVYVFASLTWTKTVMVPHVNQLPLANFREQISVQHFHS